MPGRRIISIDNEYIKTVDDDGVIRKIKLESDSQFEYRNSLRIKLGKERTKDKMPVFKASKSIDFMLKQLEKKKTTEHEQMSFNL